MELELGFKISKALDDYSSADLRISKDRGGPLFVSRETDSMFVLTVHLKGYKKEHIKIDINEDGTRIAINGERLVQEMVLVNWQLKKKEAEKRGFRKVFNIPEGVNLDKIKARFDENEDVLAISMPKLIKGLSGLKIEEIIEKESLYKENESFRKENDEIVTEISPDTENENAGKVVEEGRGNERKENESLAKENDEIVYEIVSASKENVNGESVAEEAKDTVQKENKNLTKENVEIVSELTQSKENKNGNQVVEEAIYSGLKEIESLVKENDEIVSELRPSKESENGGQVVEEAKDMVSKEVPQTESNIQGQDSDHLQENDIVDQQANEERQSNEKGSKLCVPMIAGTAFIVSILVFVMHLVRANNASNKKKS